LHAPGPGRPLRGVAPRLFPGRHFPRQRADHRLPLRAARHADRDPGRRGDRRLARSTSWTRRNETEADRRDGERTMSLIPACPHCVADRPSRRSLLAGIAAGAAAPIVGAPPAAAASAAADAKFMRIAIAEARHADFPFGAALVRGRTAL